MIKLSRLKSLLERRKQIIYSKNVKTKTEQFKKKFWNLFWFSTEKRNSKLMKLLKL